VRNKWKDAFKLLLKKQRIDVNVREDDAIGGYTALHYATKSANLEVSSFPRFFFLMS
jgi:hypothetical protein